MQSLRMAREVASLGMRASKQKSSLTAVVRERRSGYKSGGQGRPMCRHLPSAWPAGQLVSYRTRTWRLRRRSSFASAVMFCIVVLQVDRVGVGQGASEERNLWQHVSTLPALRTQHSAAPALTTWLETSTLMSRPQRARHAGPATCEPRGGEQE